MILLKNRQGFVLIFSLWVLALLTVLASSVAVGVRQKITLVQTLDERSRVRYVLESAGARARSFIRQEIAKSQFIYTPSLKASLHNNPFVFERMSLGDDFAIVPTLGAIDEESKINLNRASSQVLTRLFVRVLDVNVEQAERLAQSILDWRQAGESTTVGFYSDEYYSNLKYPYPQKNGDYQLLDELLLVKGVTQDIYKRLLSYVTIYGEGRVNINTASSQVLEALGLDSELVSKIISVRRGKDMIEATADDHIFYKTFDIPAEVNAVIKLENSQMRSIDALNVSGALTANSYYFSIDLEAHLERKNRTKHARMVFSPRENKVLYWNEK
jgi:general secretion pathway protein K